MSSTVCRASKDHRADYSNRAGPRLARLPARVMEKTTARWHKPLWRTLQWRIILQDESRLCSKPCASFCGAAVNLDSCNISGRRIGAGNPTFTPAPSGSLCGGRSPELSARVACAEPESKAVPGKLLRIKLDRMRDDGPCRVRVQQPAVTPSGNCSPAELPVADSVRTLTRNPQHGGPVTRR